MAKNKPAITIEKDRPTITIEIPEELQLTAAEKGKLSATLKDKVIGILLAKPGDVVTADETNQNNTVKVTTRLQRSGSLRTSHKQSPKKR